jgi:hypothetical protein
MKLKDVVTELLGNENISPDFDTIKPDSLEIVKELILETDEFKDVDELIILDKPIVGGDNPKVVQTRKFGKNTKFKKKAFLFTLSLTPPIYDPKMSQENKKLNEYGISISPTMYSPINFKPEHRIQFMAGTDFHKSNYKELLKEELYSKVDELVGNLDKYSAKPIREVMVRGLFEYVEDGEGNVTEDSSIGNLNVESKHVLIYYMTKSTVENLDGETEVNLKLEKKLLPIELKDKWEEEYGHLNHGDINEELIDNFINENT